jgi:hypothetical protein
MNPDTEKELASYLANTKNLGRNVILILALFIPALLLFPLMNLHFHAKSKKLQADPELAPMIAKLGGLRKKELVALSKGLDLNARIAEFYLLRDAHKSAAIWITLILVVLAVSLHFSGLV